MIVLLYLIAFILSTFYASEAFNSLIGKLSPRRTALSSSTLENGAPVQNLVEFMHLMEELKLKKRTGWIDWGIHEDKAESIGDHMYRMAIMSMLFSHDPSIDAYKCLKMALVHDMAESITTDITPDSEITPTEKHNMEEDAMQHIRSMLKGNPFADEAVELWREYAADSTPEAKFVKDLDKAELIFQVVEYENRYGINFKVWINNARPKIRNPTLQAMVDKVLQERKLKD